MFICTLKKCNWFIMCNTVYFILFFLKRKKRKEIKIFNMQNMKNKNRHLQSSRSLKKTGYHLCSTVLLSSRKMPVKGLAHPNDKKTKKEYIFLLASNMILAVQIIVAGDCDIWIVQSLLRFLKRFVALDIFLMHFFSMLRAPQTKSQHKTRSQQNH